jgi:hypothetical protein
MKATRHNGRSGKHGTYDAKHNDRRFDVENSEHIDAERTKFNVYWDCYQGYSLPNDENERAKFTFTEVEKAYYVEKYSDHVDGQNERNRKARHYDRVKTIDGILENNKTCPEETLLQLGNIDGTVSADVLAQISAEYFEEFNKLYGSHVHILNWALHLKEQGRGKNNEVPTIIIAGASIDDVFAITLFSVFLSLAAGGQSSVLQSVISVPVSILAGIVSGIILGFILSFLFSKKYTSIRATEKALILLICGTLLVQVGDSFHFASLLGLMTCGFIILEKHEHIAHELSQKLSKIWIFAEIILFVLIGFSLDIETAGQAGLKGLLAVSAGLVFRSLGVILATAFSKLTFKERLFCVIAYLPKATVQAALGGVALSAGLPEGNTILAIAVVAILFTAPLGLLGISFFGKRLLDDGEKPV